MNAWANKRDENGQTPCQCAMAVQNLKSVQLIKAKLDALEGRSHQVCINIPPDSLIQTWAQGSSDGRQGGPEGPCVQLAGWADTASSSAKNASVIRSSAPCRIHARRAHFGGVGGRAFRPFLLSLVAIATICVCVCVVIRTPPNVLFLKRPFRWEGVLSGPK